MKIMQNEWTKWKLMELVKINENNEKVMKII